MTALIFSKRVQIQAPQDFDGWWCELSDYHAVDTSMIIRDLTDLNGLPGVPTDPNLIIVEITNYKLETLAKIESDPRFVVLEVLDE